LIFRCPSNSLTLFSDIGDILGVPWEFDTAEVIQWLNEEFCQKNASKFLNKAFEGFAD
jgi:hypothetical protein